MTPRQRSFLISSTALVLAGVGVYLGASSLTGDGGDPLRNSQGQRIENVADAADDELSATSSSTPSVAGAKERLDGIEAAGPVVPAPAEAGDTGGSEPTTEPGEADPSADDPPVSEAPTAIEPTTTTEASSTSESTPSSEPPPPSSSITSTTAPGGLNGVELEIFRLTNELRANPSGPLARQKAMPPCVNEEFYGIAIDPGTGHPTAVPALTLNEAVSLEMSRPWAVDMDGRNTMSHRPNDSQLGIYSQLGTNVSAIGENVAWFQGYPDSQAAQIHFEGWRESDTGHYCALVSGTYTHVGVGHYRGATKSWAVQNYYEPR